MRNLLPSPHEQIETAICVAEAGRLQFPEGVYEPLAPRPIPVVCRRVRIDGQYKAAIRAYAENSILPIRVPRS